MRRRYPWVAEAAGGRIALRLTQVSTQTTARGKKKRIKRERLAEPPPVLCACGCVPYQAANGDGFEADTSWHDGFMAAMRGIPNASRAATAAGVSRKLAYIHRDHYPGFRERWEESKQAALDDLVEKGWKRAERVSDTLWLRIVATHRPEYRERVEVMRVATDGWTPEQWSAVEKQMAEYPGISIGEAFSLAVQALGLTQVN